MANLLLLSCCAPCSAGVIKKLASENRQFTVLFFNPN
ncbi:MAG: epoxyqueuosine reductase QueH, partial [Elusimicrobiaceae bacterium]|nr:epoxyqueuosine reductase QueH [Elusimicrobiaceae bacterium]